MNVLAKCPGVKKRKKHKRLLVSCGISLLPASLFIYFRHIASITMGRFIYVIFIIFLALGICFQSFSQSTTLAGRVINKELRPLAKVKVFSHQSIRPVETNDSGYFFLKISDSVVIVQVSYFGYDTLRRKISIAEQKRTERDTIFYEFILNERETVLETIDIVNKNNWLAYDHPEILILDYDFTETGFILLIKEKNNYKLRHTDSSSNTLCDVLLRKKPESLTRDCFNFIQLIFDDSVNQVNMQGNLLDLMPAVSISEFIYYVTPCCVSTNDKIYLKSFGRYNQTVIYYSVDNNTHEKQVLKYLRDKDAEEFSDLELNLIEELRSYDLSDVGELWGKEIDIVHDTKQREWLYKQVVSQPTYNPLFHIGEKLILFDHIHDSVFIYASNGVEIDRKFISYHHSKDWKREMIADAARQKIYSLFEKKGIVYFSEINPQTGNISGEFKIKGHIYPQKIKIKNHSVYYLYNERNDFSVSNLYKQPLR